MPMKKKPHLKSGIALFFIGLLAVVWLVSAAICLERRLDTLEMQINELSSPVEKTVEREARLPPNDGKPSALNWRSIRFASYTGKVSYRSLFKTPKHAKRRK